MLGPMGVGVLWRGVSCWMACRRTRRGRIHEIDLTSQEFEHGALKFGAGTPNVAGAVGLAAAVRYLSDHDRAAIDRLVTALHGLSRKAT
jgi:cysteine desulfurase/selenocysteine lyase